MNTPLHPIIIDKASLMEQPTVSKDSGCRFCVQKVYRQLIVYQLSETRSSIFRRLVECSSMKK